MHVSPSTPEITPPSQDFQTLFSPFPGPAQGRIRPVDYQLRVMPQPKHSDHLHTQRRTYPISATRRPCCEWNWLTRHDGKRSSRGGILCSRGSTRGARVGVRERPLVPSSWFGHEAARPGRLGIGVIRGKGGICCRDSNIKVLC
jgi:hypothetical protein